MGTISREGMRTSSLYRLFEECFLVSALARQKLLHASFAALGKSVHLQAPSGSHEVSSSSRVYLIGLQKGIGHDVNVDMSSFPLLSDDLDDDPFGALPIEFAVEEALPRTKVDPAIGDGQDDLVMRASGF